MILILSQSGITRLDSNKNRALESSEEREIELTTSLYHSFVTTVYISSGFFRNPNVHLRQGIPAPQAILAGQPALFSRVNLLQVGQTPTTPCLASSLRLWLGFPGNIQFTIIIMVH